jgi:tetratricopeptide (TPR) repeat protein
MADDWFRNTSWDDGIARRFDEKLGRARRKAQYLRIQACTLAPTHPRVALALLDRYFALGDDFDHAQAHCDRATALRALGESEAAADAYEAALAREADFRHLLTSACLELPVLVVTSGLRARFDRALAVLDDHVHRLMFPAHHFLWHAARALLLADRGDVDGAIAHARSARAAAAQTHSGFRYHPHVGLVTREEATLLARIDALLANDH